MKTKQYIKQKESKKNMDVIEKTPNCMPESSQNQELNLSTEASTQAEDYLLVKHTIKDEDLNLMVKNFIRLILALEHTRTPIKKEDIAKKVLLPSHSRSFAIVFKKTQEKLRNIFGMELVELPCKNRYKHMSTFQLRRNNNSQTQTSSSATQSNKSWILCSILDPKYSNLIFETPTIKESVFSGIVMIILSFIVMNNGIISEELLKKHLSHLQIDNNIPNGDLDKTLKEMVKKGYIERIEEDTTSMSEKEKSYAYFLGQRGKTEIDSQRLATFIEKIHGDTSPQHLKQIVEELFEKSISNEF
ncbi:hypothetical protein PCANB_002873 [Pneumocystis canis]|nr:hypothetical protein PCK1_002845 [Pneumocystis canis]KAG5438385.1 hypothetical protein PCANB_002873 [Pneumocystis canis]